MHFHETIFDPKITVTGEFDPEPFDIQLRLLSVHLHYLQLAVPFLNVNIRARER